MFVLATKRANFLKKWTRIFEKRGPVVHVQSFGELYALPQPNQVCLVMLDLALPENYGSATLSQVRKSFEHAKLLLGGIHFEPATELNGLAAGAVGCLDAALPYEEYEKIVDVVLQGGIWLSSASIPILANKLQNLAEQKRVEAPKPETKSSTVTQELHKLTKRERQVADLVSNGANNKTIARQLFITDRTVKAHLTSIYDKLNISDRLQLALHVSAHSAKNQNHAIAQI